MEAPPFPLSSRPYPDFLLNGSHRATHVVLLKENHKPLTEAATLDRKSGGAEGSAGLLTRLKMFFPSRKQELRGAQILVA